MKLNGTFWVGLGLLMLLLLVSCQSGEETAVINTPTIVPTRTAVPMQTLLPPTETMEATPLPTATATQTPVVTLTPLPTFAPDELETAVADLLANPMNCDVPCWWGAVPGETTIDEINQKIAPYNFNIEEYSRGFGIKTGYFREASDFEIEIYYSFSDYLLRSVTVYHSQLISEVLAQYGQPDEVWLATGGGRAFFRLNLVYLNAGMAVGYVVEKVGDTSIMLQGCFASYNGSVRLIIPEAAKSTKDFGNLFEEDRHYLQLEEATGLMMDEFMQKFSDPSQPQCIETPTELWE